MNIQTCPNAICLERQWNGSDERQFEDRFHRYGQKKAVVIDYLLASGTIDEFMTKIVETKKRIFHDHVGNDEPFNIANDPDALRDLLKTCLENRL